MHHVELNFNYHHKEICQCELSTALNVLNHSNERNATAYFEEIYWNANVQFKDMKFILNKPPLLCVQLWKIWIIFSCIFSSWNQLITKIWISFAILPSKEAIKIFFLKVQSLWTKKTDRTYGRCKFYIQLKCTKFGEVQLIEVVNFWNKILTFLLQENHNGTVCSSGDGWLFLFTGFKRSTK